MVWQHNHKPAIALSNRGRHWTTTRIDHVALVFRCWFMPPVTLVGHSLGETFLVTDTSISLFAAVALDLLILQQRRIPHWGDSSRLGAVATMARSNATWKELPGFALVFSFLLDRLLLQQGRRTLATGWFSLHKRSNTSGSHFLKRTQLQVWTII
jgi:hypothetical protein